MGLVQVSSVLQKDPRPAHREGRPESRQIFRFWRNVSSTMSAVCPRTSAHVTTGTIPKSEAGPGFLAHRPEASLDRQVMSLAPGPWVPWTLLPRLWMQTSQL